MDAIATRIEKDFLGEKEIPANAYYGVQTLRGKENFHITGIPMSLEPNFVKAFGYVKKAAALANRDLGVLDAEDRQRDRQGVRQADRRRDARAVRHRLHPGRRGNVDQHERERGDREPRARGTRAPQGRIPVRQSERPRQLRAIDQRYLSMCIPARADPPARQLHGSAASAAGSVLREEQRVRQGAEDGPHAPAGRGADVARAGIPRLGHDARRGSAADHRSAPVPARDQPWRDGDRHDGDGGARLPRTGHQVFVRTHGPEIHSCR